MELFDTHFHFYCDQTPIEFMKDIYEFTKSDVEKLNLMAVGGNFTESLRALEFANTIENSWFAAGVHPHNADEYCKSRDDFSKLMDSDKLKAIGELGLDYYYDFSDRQVQRLVFAEFLSLALKMNKPAIVHLRDKDGVDEVYKDAYEQLLPFANNGGEFVVHCFAGSTQWAQRFLDIGGYLGVTGMVTFKRAENIRQVLKIIPLDRLLLETDSPYLAPVPYRGSDNHPGMVRVVAQFASDYLNISLTQLAQITTNNGMQFFKIAKES